jgi:hypothetical protein
MARYSPTVLPRYYGGDMGAEISAALEGYVNQTRQEKFDAQALTQGEIGLYEDGYRPELPADAQVDPADQAAQELEALPQAPTLGDIQPGAQGHDMLMRRDPRAPAPRPGAGALAREQGQRYFKLANGGYYSPDASQQREMIREDRGYREYVRGDENQREDRLITDDRGYRDRVRGEENVREDRLIADDRNYRREETAAEREFRLRQGDIEFGRERQMLGARTAAERALMDRRAELVAAAVGAAGGSRSSRSSADDPRWDERRKAAVRVLGEPTTPLRQDIADALADGMTPEQILAEIEQSAPNALEAASEYLQMGEMFYQGDQTPFRNRQPTVGFPHVPLRAP